MRKAIVSAFLAGVLTAASAAGSDWSRIFLGSCPSVSADGAEFVFEWNDSIWRAPAGGGVAVRLTPEATREGWPLLSPDGKRMAFLSNRDGGWKVFEMDLATLGVRQITRHSEYTAICGWAPDGVTIAGMAVRDAAPSDKATRMALFRPDGSEAFPLENVPVSHVAMSPDGRYVALTRRGDDIYRKRRTGRSPQDAEIWLYDFMEGKFVRANTLSEGASHAVWRPDGRGFYYLGRRPGSIVAGVREYLLDGGDREVVSFGEDAAFQPAVSADGRTMVVRAGFDFWRLDPTETSPRPTAILLRPEGVQPRLDGTRRRYYDKAWNNDYGGDVSFASNGKEVSLTVGGGLYAMDTIIRSPRLVRDVRCARVTECMFAPDGSRLYYLVDFGDRSEVCVAERADATLPWWENTQFIHTTLLATDEVLYRFSVSPDGGRLAWANQRGTMTFADTTGRATGEVSIAATVSSYYWSPDGRYVAAELIDANNNADIWIVSVEGETPPCNISRNWEWDGTPVWSPDGQIVAWTGKRPSSAVNEIYYVYLDPEVEARERAERFARSRREIVTESVDGDGAAGSGEGGDKRVKIVFDGLFERVRATGAAGVAPFFSYDSRTLAFDTGSATDTLHVPDRMRPERLIDKRGRNAVWYEKDNRLAWVIDDRPYHFSAPLSFKIYREDDLADYRELVFRTAWARIRDKFYDRNYHGADWGAVKEKYLPAARNASSYSVFTRVMKLMLGELDASHLGFYPSQAAQREWIRESDMHSWAAETGHLGVKFRPGTYEVAEVIPGSPAEGVLSAGDVILAIDGVKPTSGTRLDELLVRTDGRQVQLTIAGRESKPVYVALSSYGSIRSLIERAEVRTARNRVHEATAGRVGYIAVKQMNMDTYQRFEDEVYSEGWDKDALILDLRGNTGGFTGDRLLSVLCGSDHARSVTPNGLQGYIFSYWARPVFSKPIAVIVDERVQSNGEIFTHAIKTLGRGVVVGRTTSGEVISTLDRPLLDYGMFRDAFWGMFMRDGTDMENNGVVPDIMVDPTPADEAAGRDVQLDAAVKAMAEAIAAPAAEFVPRYAK